MIVRFAAAIAQLQLFVLWGWSAFATWQAGGDLFPSLVLGALLIAGAVAGHVAARRNAQVRLYGIDWRQG